MSKKYPYTAAVIVAAGSGTRMGKVSKPLIKLGNRTVFEMVLSAFLSSSFINEIIVVTKDEASLRPLVPASADKPVRFAPGGNTRTQSVGHGVDACGKQTAFVCIHDCARPFITPEDIEKTVLAAYETGASSACSAVKDTIKYHDPEAGLLYTPKRDKLLALQTPQVFKKELYLVSFAKGMHDGLTATDETTLAEHAGFTVSYVDIGEHNRKLTDAEDVKLAKAMLFLDERAKRKEENP